MSAWLARLRGLRQESASGIEIRTEASARVPSEFTDVKKGSPPTFVPNIILEQVWDRDNIEHMFKMATENPVGRRIVYLVAEKALDDWFVIRTPDGDEHPLNEEIQREFKRLRAKYYFTQALAGERWGGNAWVQVVRERPALTIDTADSLQEPRRIANLDFWTINEATVKRYNTVTGAPETINIKYKVGVAENNTTEVNKDIPAKEMILIRTRPYDRSEAGLSIMDPVWDYMVWLQLMFHAVSWYGIKVGMGWLYAKVRKLTDQKKTAMEANFKDMSIMRFLLFEPDVEDIGFIQAQGGSINFDAFVDAILDQIAAGTDLPKVVLTGQEQGNISAGESIERALYSTINSIQQAIEPALRECILHLNYDDDDMVLDWNTRFAHDAKQEAEIEVAHVSAQVARKGYMTINEIRALDKMEPIEGGDRSPAEQEDFSIGVKGMPPSKQEQTQNPEGTNLG